ncbi:MAG: methionyl-tRNA formyltransferase [Longicatena sp.]
MSIKILFMGTPEIAVSMFEQLMKDEYEVIGVVTQPDKRVGRKQEYQMSPVKQVALEHNIPVYQPIKIRDDYQMLMKLDVDLIVTCAYGQFIPDVLLQMPTFGSINVHASLLPKLRGGAPIHKAIINGDMESGVSIMRMVAKMDAGAVMSQCRVKIEQEDTMGSLYEKLAVAGAALLSESIPLIIDGSAVFVEQDEEQASFAYTIQKEEEWIDFHRDVQDVYNHIRGLMPTPCGYALMDGKKVKFHKVRMIKNDKMQKAGEVLGYQENGFAIGAKQGIIIVDEIQMEGKAKSDAKSFFNGAGKAMVGKCFK